MVSLSRVLQSLISSRCDDEFGKFFSGIGSKIKEDTSHRYPAKSNTLFENNQGEHYNFQFRRVSIKELAKIVKNLKSKAISIEGFNLKAFKIVSAYLLHVFFTLLTCHLKSASSLADLNDRKSYQRSNQAISNQAYDKLATYRLVTTILGCMNI